MDWSTLTGHTPLSTHFCELIFEFNLDQQIMEPILINDVIILTYTSCIENISVSVTLPHELSSDHYLINLSLNSTHAVELSSHPCYSVFNFCWLEIWDVYGILAFWKPMILHIILTVMM